MSGPGNNPYKAIASQGFGHVWNQTEPNCRPKTGQLVGYPHLLLTLLTTCPLCDIFQCLVPKIPLELTGRCTWSILSVYMGTSGELTCKQIVKQISSVLDCILGTRLGAYCQEAWDWVMKCNVQCKWECAQEHHWQHIENQLYYAQ
jgi:hypothetical protein